MRVLHLIDSFGLYGAEKVALDLVQSQNRRGWRSWLGSIRRPEDAERPFEAAARERGVDVVRFPMRRGVNLVGGLRIVEFAREKRIDLIHSHSYKGNIIIGLLPRNLRTTPLLITLHGWRPPKTALAQFIQRLERSAIYRAEHVVAVHPSLAADPRLAKLPPTRLSVICNGISSAQEHIRDERFKTEQSRNDQIVQSIRGITGTYSIAAIGRLSAEKGFDLLIRSVANLRRRGTDCSLIIFGEGEQRPYLEKLIAELQLEPHVHLLGYVPNASTYLNTFDCLAIPSKAEGCPLVALEGMLERVPIVASRAGGLPEMLQDNRCGRLVNIGDVAALEKALVDVRASPDLTGSQVQAAHANVTSNYQRQDMRQAYIDLYEQVTPQVVSTSSAYPSFGRSQKATTHIIPQDS